MSIRSVLWTIAILAAGGNMEPYEREPLPKEEPKKPIKKRIPKNHKEFFFGEKSVWALSKKNAIKKAKKLGYLN